MSAHISASTRLARAFTLASLFGGLSAGSLFAANGTWTSTSGGNWTNTGNWSGGISANGTDAVATFSANGTQTVTLDANQTVGTLAFSNGTYTLAASNNSVLTLATSTGTPNISSTANITATLAGTQGFTMNPGGSRTLTLSANNTYGGVTTLTNGNLIIRANNGLGATGAGNGTTVSQGTNGFPQLHIANSITTGEDITIRMNWQNSTNGTIIGGGALIGNTSTGNLLYNDSGTNSLNGTLTLDRQSPNTNNIYVWGVQISGNNSILNLNGNIGGVVTGSQASGNYADPNRIQFRATAATAIANVTGVISNGNMTTGGLSVYTATDSTGIVRLSGANTYTGSTVHQKGTLLINNTTGSGTGTGAVSVASAAIFGGTGTITPGGSNSVTFASGSIVAPGDVTNAGVAIAAGKVLTFDLSNTTGNVTFASGAIISIDLNGDAATIAESFSFLGLNAGVADVLFNGNTVNFSVSGTALADGLYTLATFDAANAYSGNWVIGTGLSAYAAKTPTLIFNANSIQLQIGTVPEPSSFAALGGMLALGFAATGRRRRK